MGTSLGKGGRGRNHQCEREASVAEGGEESGEGGGVEEGGRCGGGWGGWEGVEEGGWVELNVASVEMDKL